MLKLCGFGLIMVQLSLAAGISADWSVQMIPFSSHLRNRAYLQMTPPRFDPPLSEPRKWLQDTYTDTKPSTASVDLWLTKRLILSMSKRLCQRIAHGRNPAFQDMCSENQNLAACVKNTCFINESFPVFLTHSDSFRFSHNGTSESGMKSNQPYMIPLKAKNSHQIIVIMEEDPAVIESATYLFERHSTISTLLRYKKGTLHIARGGHFFTTRNHDVILVGHGSKSTNETVQLAGYSPEELARFVSALKTEIILGHLGTITLISCNIGNDLHFILRLLQVLRSLGIETKLHLFNSFMSVSSEGKLVTRTDGVWKSHDHSRRVIAELDPRGNLLTKAELGCTGPVLPDYKGSVLYLQTLDWPNHPQMFVPMELRKKYPSIDCLEGLTWSLFFEENERRRAPDYVPDNNRKHLKAIWLTEPGPKEDNSVVIKHIVTIQDLLLEVRYNAREEVTLNLYYVLNECIYEVHGKNLSVSLVGKFMSPDNQDEIERFRQNFSGQHSEASLLELRQGLKAYKFNDFCRQTFQFQQCSYNCERWGHYFMVAVFSASVRNFRTFSLFLMSVIGCEVGRLQGTDSPLCTAFVGDDHPMLTEQPWPEQIRRGFYGCTVENYELAPQDRQIWLDEVIGKENALFMKSKQLMNGLYHDEQTELDIFGRVKVMNKYVFSSFLEFFRGTPEGKRLKRGCTPTFNEKLKP